MSDSRVFFSIALPASRSARDLSSANRYGAIHFVMDHESQPSLMPGPAMIKARKALQDFNPEKDYVSHAGGDPMSLLVVGAVLAGMGVRKFQYLRYDRELRGGTRTGGGFYVPVPITLQHGTGAWVGSEGDRT